MVLIDGKKMSKSLNNFIFIIDLFPSPYHPNVFRLMVLQSSYRSPFNFSTPLLTQSNNLWSTILKILSFPSLYKENIPSSLLPSILTPFTKAMDDDLNTSLAISNLFPIIKRITTSINCINHNQIPPLSISNLFSYIHTLKYILSILGFSDLPQEINDLHQESNEEINPFSPNITNGPLADIERLIEERNTFRRNKEYLKADIIRRRLLEMGITLIDLSDKTIYKYDHQ